MRTVLAMAGAIVIGFAVLGSLGIGHFRLYYGPNDPALCKQP